MELAAKKSLGQNFLKSEVSKELVRELEEKEEGYSSAIWNKMAELGWMGLVFSEEHGGVEMDFLTLVVLFEEMGRNLLPGPFFSTVILGAYPILEAGTDEQKNEFLPGIAEGKLKLTLALTEPSAIYAASGVSVKAIPDSDDYIINGTKLFIENAHISDYLIVVARTKEASNPEEGITLFIVDAKSPGIKTSVIPTIALDKQCEVIFENVRVPKKNILGTLDKGWEIVNKVIEKAMVIKCAEMVGGLQAALEITNAYVKERIQYQKPIGANQVIQHYLANIWVYVETSKNITYEAAWMINEGLPCTQKVSAAKAWLGDAFKWSTERCVQIHGGIGMTREHDIGLYYRRAKAWDLAFGDSDYQREVIANVLDS